MKISVVNNIFKRSQLKATKAARKTTNKATNSIQNSAQEKNIPNIGLIALGGIGIASVALYALNKNNPNIAKNIKQQVTKIKPSSAGKVPSKKRGAQAVRQYQYELNMRKMESLHARLLTDEFRDKTPEAMQRIQRNAINLAKETGCLKV